MMVCDAERRAVVDNLGVDRLLQMMQESQDELHRNALANILYQFTRCSEWMESLSPDSNLVSRIFSLPFLSIANAFATERALSTATKLLQLHRSFRRALAGRTSLLVDLFELVRLDDDSVELAATACRLLLILQHQQDFDFLAFEEARVHVSCVELLGQLRCYREGHSSGLTSRSYVEPTVYLLHHSRSHQRSGSAFIT